MIQEPARKTIGRTWLLFWSAIAVSIAFAPTAAGAQDEADDPALLEQGEAVYSASCAGVPRCRR